jgi:hypothetical protein
MPEAGSGVEIINGEFSVPCPLKISFAGISEGKGKCHLQRINFPYIIKIPPF